MLISNAYASAAEHASSGGGGMPQFDSSTFSSQAFWAVVSFIVLMTLLAKYVLPAIAEILDQRGKKIGREISDAEKMRRESEEMLAKYKKDLANANQEAVKIVEEAKVTALRVSENKLAELDEELTKKKKSAIAEIEQLKRQALAEINELAVDVAMQATEKLIAKAVSKADANKMVTDAIDEIRQQDALH
jgi:F-type H+-transporting ATPase subunit b